MLNESTFTMPLQGELHGELLVSIFFLNWSNCSLEMCITHTRTTKPNRSRQTSENTGVHTSPINPCPNVMCSLRGPEMFLCFKCPFFRQHCLPKKKKKKKKTLGTHYRGSSNHSTTVYGKNLLHPRFFQAVLHELWWKTARTQGPIKGIQKLQCWLTTETFYCTRQYIKGFRNGSGVSFGNMQKNIQ